VAQSSGRRKRGDGSSVCWSTDSSSWKVMSNSCRQCWILSWWKWEDARYWSKEKKVPSAHGLAIYCLFLSSGPGGRWGFLTKLKSTCGYGASLLALWSCCCDLSHSLHF
jgi:hypothetical protein